MPARPTLRRVVIAAASSRRRSRPPSRSCSSTSSSSACRESADDVRRPRACSAPRSSAISRRRRWRSPSARRCSASLAGCMPGLSATLVITLLTTLTLKMQPNQAILVLVCAYNGAIYGGSRTAILLNIPGTAANAAACLDGYALARQGQAGRAMGIATTGSVRRHAVRPRLPRAVHADARRGRARASAPSSSSGWRCSASSRPATSWRPIR